jgi:hypothetical protein
MTVSLLQPGEIEAAAGDIPELRLPPADLFLMRARRLEQLAEHHAMGDYLRFAARLARAQQDLLDAGPATVLPSPVWRGRKAGATSRGSWPESSCRPCRRPARPPCGPSCKARTPGWTKKPDCCSTATRCIWTPPWRP